MCHLTRASPCDPARLRGQIVSRNCSRTRSEPRRVDKSNQIRIANQISWHSLRCTRASTTPVATPQHRCLSGMREDGISAGKWSGQREWGVRWSRRRRRPRYAASCRQTCQVYTVIKSAVQEKRTATSRAVLRRMEQCLTHLNPKNDVPRILHPPSQENISAKGGKTYVSK